MKWSDQEYARRAHHSQAQSDLRRLARTYQAEETRRARLDRLRPSMVDVVSVLIFLAAVAVLVAAILTDGGVV